MPTATNDGVSLYYEIDGETGPAVASVGDVGTGAWLWSWQAPALAGDRRTAVFDARSTGRSDPPGAVDTLLKAMRDFDASGRLHEIGSPALVLHGLADRVVPAAAGRPLADGLPRGEFEGVEAGSHWCFVEQARLVTAVIDGFLDR